jgi:hypothetical protein
MSKKLLSLASVSVVLLLIVTFAVAVVSAFPDDVIREKTFITYEVAPLGTPGTDTYNVYAYSGIHWKAGSFVTYSVNIKGAPTGAITEVAAAFETWDTEIGDLFNDNVAVAGVKLVGSKFDGKNVVSWGRLGRGIIAQTTVWYYTSNLEIAEFGMVFSTAYKWGIDADGEGTQYTLTGAFDVRDIATHEAGHTLMLDDLYMTEASALTMYGYGDFGETYAISLGAGDRSGVKAIYP